MTAESSPSMLVVAGEASGEEHAAGLVRALQSGATPTRFFGSGGREMNAAGVDLIGDVADLGAIGPVSAVTNLAAYRKLFRRLLEQARRRRPRLAILVDFPEFNLRLAPRLKRLGIPVCYFIGPQLWAWRQGRMKQIRRWVDLMLVILPFEEEFYGRHGVTAHYVGNPTAARLAPLTSRIEMAETERSGRVALLPGSRRGEVELNLPVQLEAAAWITRQMTASFEIAPAPGLDEGRIERICRSWRRRDNEDVSLTIASEPVETVLLRSDAAIVKSGTSTLEAMVLGVPFVMTYRLPWLSWILLRPFVRLRRFCLANLVAGNDVVPEFVQHRATGDRIGNAVVKILRDDRERWEMIEGLAVGRRKLGTRDAFFEAARRIRERFPAEPVGSRGVA